MENRKRRAQISFLHKSFKKKLINTSCPGCQNSYASQQFHVHKSVYFDDANGEWTCRKEASCGQVLVSNSLETNNDCNVSKDSPVYLHEQLRKSVRKHLKSVLTKNDIDDTDDDSDTNGTDIEIWNNVTIDDVNRDIGEHCPRSNDAPNMSKPFTLVLWLCLFICTLQVAFMLPDRVVAEMLRFISSFLRVISDTSPLLASISVLFPSSMYMLWKTLSISKDNFTKYVVCKKCFNIYTYGDCVMTLEGKEVSKTCPFIPYPNHTQRARRQACGELLLRSVMVDRKETLYPFKTYTYSSVIKTVSRLVNKENFVANCNNWRERLNGDMCYADVYDGRVWKHFMTIDQQHFLLERNNYALMLNLDWFQPFKHVHYSVGVVYAVILNLPRSERFKVDNVLLISIIPDMKKEPPVSTFLKPLVDELNMAWNEGFMSTTSEHPKTPVRIKLALLCVGCDIPATRKLCGFLGHSATLGCSKCFKTFPGSVGEKDYSGFDRELWPSRSSHGHCQLLNKLQTAKTQTEKQHLESRFGVRYSCLVELPYFDVVRFSTIDPMHNFFQGTAKHMVKLWLKAGALDEKKFQAIQTKVDGVNPASSVGKIPKKIASSFDGFTAEQWKNWTNIFSIFALKGILGDKYLRNWRYFVKASRALCSKFLTQADIAYFDENIITFCNGIEELFGKEAVTPNMHLHGHMADCLRDFGPVHSFWLFSFERYNGHLGDMPNNHRAVEIQFMRRFQRDALVISIPVPKQFQEDLSPCVTLVRTGSEETAHNHPVDVYMQLRRLAEPTTAIANQAWSDITMYNLQNMRISTIDVEELNALRKTYQVLYPSTDTTTLSIPISCRKIGYVSCGHEVIGSLRSRHKRSSFIMANWNAPGGKIVSDKEIEVAPGVVKIFVLHNLTIEGKNMLHLFAQVQWCSPKQNLKNTCGYPVQVWSDSLFETIGESTFIPVQRIRCKAVVASGKLRNKCVLYVIPIGRGLEF